MGQPTFTGCAGIADGWRARGGAQNRREYDLHLRRAGSDPPTVTVVVEAKDEITAKAKLENFEYHLGCFEDAQTDYVDVEEGAPQDELDVFVDAENPINQGGCSSTERNLDTPQLKSRKNIMGALCNIKPPASRRFKVRRRVSGGLGLAYCVPTRQGMELLRRLYLSPL